MENLDDNLVHESNESGKNNLIERYQEGRLKIANMVSEKIKKHPDVARFLSAAVNATAGSYIKLSAEAIAGKSADGQDLTPLGRLTDALIVGSGLGGYALLASGKAELAGLSYGSSWGLYLLMYSADIVAPVINKVADKVESNNISQTLRAISKVCELPKKAFFKQNG